MLKRDQRNFLPLAITLCISLLCLAQTACKTTPINPKHRSDSQPHGEKEQKNRNKAVIKDSNVLVAYNTTNKNAKFSLDLQDDSQRATKNNFISLIIAPNNKGLDLKNLFITASVSLSGGELKGVSGNSGTSHMNLDGKSLGNFYLASSTCKGSKDENFKQGKEVIFRLRYRPPENIPKETGYKLTVTITDKSSKKVEKTISLTTK